MNFSNDVLSLVKEHSKLIRSILYVKGTIPVKGTVSDKTDKIKSTDKEKIFDLEINALSLIPAVGDLKVLAKDPASLSSISNGKVKTGAVGLKNHSLHSNLNYIRKDINRILLSKEFMVTDPNIVGETIDEEVPFLRICTDGKKSKLMKDNNNYDDRTHDNETSCFGKYISADKIPYIVVPLGVDYDMYKYSVGAIIDKHGNYLHCVVAERGPAAKGMGEVSIYAAWKMNGWTVPPKMKTKKDVKEQYMIAEKNQYQYKDGMKEIPKNSIPWRIVVFEKSAPIPKGRSGWHYITPEGFRLHIYNIGKKYFQGKGECLYTSDDRKNDKKIFNRKKALKRKQDARRKQNLKKQEFKKQKFKSKKRKI